MRCPGGESRRTSHSSTAVAAPGSGADRVTKNRKNTDPTYLITNRRRYGMQSNGFPTKSINSGKQQVRGFSAWNGSATVGRGGSQNPITAKIQKHWPNSTRSSLHMYATRTQSQTTEERNPAQPRRFNPWNTHMNYGQETSNGSRNRKETSMTMRENDRPNPTSGDGGDTPARLARSIHPT